MPTNIVFSSGVTNTPVISHCLGPNQEAANLAGRRIGAQHLVVAEAGIVARVDRRGRHVGLDPEPAARRHVDAVGRAELVAVDRRAVGRDRRVAAEGENVPLEVRLGQSPGRISK